MVMDLLTESVINAKKDIILLERITLVKCAKQESIQKLEVENVSRAQD